MQEHRKTNQSASKSKQNDSPDKYSRLIMQEYSTVYIYIDQSARKTKQKDSPDMYKITKLKNSQLNAMTCNQGYRHIGRQIRTDSLTGR